MRPAHQLLQREDLPGVVVLAGRPRGVHRPRPGALGVGPAAGAWSSALRPSESEDHGPVAYERHAGCRTRPQDVASFHRVLPATGRRLRPEATCQELDRPGRGRHRGCSVGQLPCQAVVGQ